MKRIHFFTSVLMGLSSSLAWAGETKNYKIDASHSNVGFTARHLIGRVNGEFVDFDGQFSFNPDDLKASKVSAKVKAESINTRDKKRDEHLRSDDFFGVKKYPTLEFKSKSLSLAGDRKYKMSGDLTMHGVTKPVTFDVEYFGDSVDPWGNHRSGFSAATKVNRKDFGMSWNKTLDKGGLLLGEEVDVTINVEGIQDQAQASAK